MNQPRTESRTHYVNVQILLDPGRDVARVRVEQRDFQFRLISRADLLPMLRGGTSRTLDEALALMFQLVADNISTDPATLRSGD